MQLLPREVRGELSDSGKSALAELIAFAAGSWHENDAGSFLKRAGHHLESLSVELEWADGATSAAIIGSNPSDENQVRYLSQKFVERLCTGTREGYTERTREDVSRLSVVEILLRGRRA